MISVTPELRDRSGWFDRHNEYKYTDGDMALDLRAVEEIEHLRGLLRRADEYVIWEHHSHVPSGFQEEIEDALGIRSHQQSPLDDVKDMKTWPEEIRRAHGIKPDR